jgi:hypothetical protein
MREFRRWCWMPFSWLTIRLDYASYLLWISCGHRAQLQFGVSNKRFWEWSRHRKGWRVQFWRPFCSRFR